MRLTFLFTLLLALLASCNRPGGGKSTGNHFKPNSDSQKEIQNALLNAKPGDTLFFAAGTYKFSRSLTLTGIKGITLKGEGMDKTIFSFKGQKAGAEGLKVKADGFAIMDLAIEDTDGDAIKVFECRDVKFIRTRVEWTNGPDSSNGAYGLYPVSCTNVLMDGCVAIAAMDAGIYVGQSDSVIVRNCRVEKNVAGLEIENTTNADCYNNLAQNNTTGILIFDMPNLPKRNGGNIKVHHNKSLNNNHPNFAPPGNIVGYLPAGSGMLVMATKNVEITDNEITDHQTASIYLVSFKLVESMNPKYEIKDKEYDAYLHSIYIHNNKISSKLCKPDLKNAFGQALHDQFKDKIPHILYDGMVHPKLGKLEGDHRICIRNNGDVQIANLDAANGYRNVKVDSKPFDCELKPQPEIKLPF